MSRLPIDLTQLSEAELIHLNHQVVERLRFLRDVRAHHHMQDLRIGDQVSFTPEAGRKVTGTVVRFNRKTLSLVATDGVHWRVAPALVSRVESRDVEVDVTPTPPQPERSAAPSGLRTLPLFQASPQEETPRNAPCPCGSGKKHKRCCLLKSANERG
jgi:hypothetical protein